MIDVYDEMMPTVFIAAITGWPTKLPVTFRVKMMKMKSECHHHQLVATSRGLQITLSALWGGMWDRQHTQEASSDGCNLHFLLNSLWFACVKY
jgi:hypothetical protein